MTSPFGGAWPAVLTPLTEEGALNLPAVEALTDLFARQGLGGLYVGGSTGQWPLLSISERQALAECVVRTAGGRIPVMMHIGAVSTADAVALARHAETIGATAVSAVAPIYYGHSADAVFQYYRAIGQATGLPLYVYHLSITHQLAIGAREYADRLLAVPGIGGMKITDGDLYRFGLLHNYTAGKLHLFSGADEVLCHAVLSGAIGAIGTFYNLWGPVCQKARAVFAGGDVVRGQRFMLRFQDAIAQTLSHGVWTFLRAGMKRRYGIDVGLPRAPLATTDKPWNDADVERILQQVETALDDH